LVININSAILVVVLGCVGGAGGAEPSEHTRELIDTLDSQSWVERDQSTIELIGEDQAISLADLEFFLNDQTLTLEQRHRLIWAIEARFLGFPKGGLGVAFGTIRVGAIEVQPIQKDPRFPASFLLNPGDAIAMIDGQVVTSSSDVRAEILSRSPGELLGVTVSRNNQLIDLDLPLGSYRDLAGAGFLDPIITKRALERRWNRRGITPNGPDTIGSGIIVDEWISAVFPRGSSPDPQIPSRHLPTAITGGHTERVQIGQTTRPQPGPAWTSPMVIEERIAIIQMKLDGIERELLDAKVRLLEQLIEQTHAEINASNDQALRERLGDKLDGLSKQVESIARELDALSEIPRRIPSPPSP